MCNHFLIDFEICIYIFESIKDLGRNHMELINISAIKDFKHSKVIKKVPIMTEQLMSTVLFIAPNTKSPAHSHAQIDEIQFIIKGSGKITVGKKSKSVKEGTLILVAKTEKHFFSTSKGRMIVLSVGIVTKHEEDIYTIKSIKKGD